MGKLSNIISSVWRDRNIVKTPYGTLRCASPSQARKVKKMVIALERSTDALTRKDLADWRRAWQLAINVDTPDRGPLYDIYRDAMIDGHLSGCIGQRQGFVKARAFKIVDSDGETNEDAQHYFDQAWFKRLLDYVLDSRWYGHSLIELGELDTDGDGCLCYQDVVLIPRKHVRPEHHRVVQNQYDSWDSGIDYRERPYADWLIEAGHPDDLGLLLKAAQHTIPKKNTLSFWDLFSEIFGMPMRIAKTTSRDDAERHRLQNMLRDMGTAATAVVPIDTEVEVVESGRGDAYNVYDRRIDRANSELSKIFIGQTMTIEDGSSLSQSQTHLEVFENIVDGDCDMIRDIINNQLIPRMIRHGFPLKGMRFEWDDTVSYTPEQQVAYETMIADRYEVDASYFADKYNMPVGERRDLLPPPTDGNNNNGDGKDGGKKTQNSIRNFFD